MDEKETSADIIAEMRFHGQQNIDAEKDRPEYGILTMEGRIALNYADRLEAALKREKDKVHHAMVILAGIEMEDSENPPRLWTAIEDAYGALSDALGTDGDTTADEEEAKATGRHFVIPSPGDAEELRKALVAIKALTDPYADDLSLLGTVYRTANAFLKEVGDGDSQQKEGGIKWKRITNCERH